MSAAAKQLVDLGLAGNVDEAARALELAAGDVDRAAECAAAAARLSESCVALQVLRKNHVRIVYCRLLLAGEIPPASVPAAAVAASPALPTDVAAAAGSGAAAAATESEPAPAEMVDAIKSAVASASSGNGAADTPAAKRCGAFGSPVSYLPRHLQTPVPTDDHSTCCSSECGRCARELECAGRLSGDLPGSAGCAAIGCGCAWAQCH